MMDYRGGDLFIEQCRAADLARRFKTPLFVYSQKTLLERFWSLKAAFRRREPLICFAMKANSNKTVCRTLAREGAGADIVSGGELLRALASGFKASRIVFSGVGKTVEELALALNKKVLTINLESMEELEALERVAKRLKKKAPISVRLNPDIDARTHAHITTGRAENKFGVEKKQALAMYRKAHKSPWLAIKGIQCHIGSQITATGPYRLAARSVAGVVRELAGLGINLELIDLGGGMGITYDQETPLALHTLAAVITEALSGLPRARLLLEPGRYLTADAGVLLTEVLYRKETSKRRFVIVDAAMNDLARPALYDAYHPIWPAVKNKRGEETVDVVGPVCESGDFLAKGRRLQRCEAGDLLAVLKAGAYGFAMSSQYNSRPRAAEVLVDGGKARLIRRRETLRDIVQAER